MQINTKGSIKSCVSLEKFQNIDMRVAKIISAPIAKDIQKPCRVITLDAGDLGTFTAVGQYAQIPEKDLVGLKVVIVTNLSARKMGPYLSEVLLLGAPHPDSPSDQAQATPFFVDDIARCGDRIF